MGMMAQEPKIEAAVQEYFARSGKLLIDGKLVAAASGKTFESRNPSNGKLLARVAKGAEADINLAVAAARKAFEGPWSKMKPADRQKILLKFADLVDQHFDELSMIDTLDMGAPISRTRANRGRILSMIRYYASLAVGLHGETIPNSTAGEFLSYTVKEPVGVVGAIIPWNGPQVGTMWKIGPVVATGCTMVLKPAEEASLTPFRLVELLHEAGLPPGVINVVTGPGETAGAALVAHPGVDKIAFTGSIATGQLIARASAVNLKRLSLELGGKSPNIVFADADIEAAIPAAAMAAFANSGQICSAGTRLFVERKIYSEFVERVAAYAAKLRVGHGLDTDSQLGPVVSEQQLQRVTGYQKIGKDEGARVATGGSRLTGSGYDEGYFIAPTVFADVTDTMRIAREEIFGPVLSAFAFDNAEEVVRRANATEFGLSSAVWTRDIGRAHRVAKAMRSGTVWINAYQVSDPAVPFGGYKMSGYGRESGAQQMNEYLNVKSVWVNTD